jgi:hypothetical protein
MRKYLTLLLLLYVFLDFSSPFLPGSFEFSPHDSEKGLHQTRLREMRPVAIAVELVRMRLDLGRPSLSRSRLLMSQMSSPAGWTIAPSFRSRSAPPADAAGDDD